MCLSRHHSFCLCGPVSHQHYSCVRLCLQGGDEACFPFKAVVWVCQAPLQSTTENVSMEVLASEQNALGKASNGSPTLAHRDTCREHHTNPPEYKVHLVQRWSARLPQFPNASFQPLPTNAVPPHPAQSSQEFPVSRFHAPCKHTFQMCPLQSVLYVLPQRPLSIPHSHPQS